jgi:ribosomal protein L4
MSIQNLPNVNVILANNLNVKSLLDSKSILISIESLKIIEETYGK